jgi:Bacterial RNA polymerase, alpha chain C terminal domain
MDCSTGFKFWRELGLSVRAANILVNLSCESLSDVRRLGMNQLLRQHGMGPPTYNEIAALLAWPLVEVHTVRRRRRAAPANDTQNLSDAGVAVVSYMIHQPKRAS